MVMDPGGCAILRWSQAGSGVQGPSQLTPCWVEHSGAAEQQDTLQFEF